VIIAGGPHCGLRSTSILGGEIYERNLLASLARHGVRIKVGLPRARPLDSPLPGTEVTLVRPGRGLRWPFAPLAFIPYTLGLLKREEVDLLRGHSVLYTGPSLFAARRLAGADVPIVLHHLHTDPGLRLLEAVLLRHADGIVTISEHSRHQLLDFGIEPGRIAVAPPGISGPPDPVGPAVQAWPKDHGLKLLFVGRLINRKRPDLAVKALRELLSRGTRASLVLAGEGPLARQLRAEAKANGLGESLALVGVVSDQQKWRLLADADVFLFPSVLEGFGFAAGEAQRAGVPVVTTSGTASSEIVADGETGFVVQPTPEAFAHALEKLSDPEVRLPMAERASLRSRRFDWDVSATRVAEFYAEIVARSRQGSRNLAAAPSDRAPDAQRHEEPRSPHCKSNGSRTGAEG
jgi:glycosyltransferase involved in cell wall biosynthesis